MKFIVRGMFAALLILTLAAQAARTSSDVKVDEAADLSDGLASLGGRILGTAPSGMLTAVVPGCPDPVNLAQVGFDGSNDNSLEAFLATNTAEPRYIYLGFVGDRPNLVSIVSRWVAASAINVFRLRHHKAPDHVVAVLLPRTCPDLGGLDWSVLSPWS